MDSIHLHDEESWLGVKVIRMGKNELRDLQKHVSGFKDLA